MVFMRCELGILGIAMTKLYEEFFNVSFHKKTAAMIWVFEDVCPFQINTCKLGPLEVQVIQMFLANILDSRIVDYKTKYDWTPLVAPHPWCRGGFIITHVIESFLQQSVGYFSRLRQTIAATNNFEVNPTVATPLGKVIFVNKVLRDIIVLYSKTFRPIHWGG